MFERCIHFFKKPISEFTDKECKIIGSVTIFLTIIIAYILSLIISYGGKRDMLIIFIAGIIPNLLVGSYIFFTYDLNKYIDLVKDGEDTRLAIILRFILVGVGLTSYMAGVIYIISNSLILGISVCSGTIYPGVFMFFRRNSCWNQTHVDDEGNIVYTYNLVEYWKNSLIYSGSICLGFIQISLALMNNNSIMFPVIWTICSVIFTSFVLIPDILRKKLPFKNERTYELLNIVAIICLIIILRIFAIIIKH